MNMSIAREVLAMMVIVVLLAAAQSCGGGIKIHIDGHEHAISWGGE